VSGKKRNGVSAVSSSFRTIPPCRFTVPRRLCAGFSVMRTRYANPPHALTVRSLSPALSAQHRGEAASIVANSSLSFHQYVAGIHEEVPLH
jgi:hypothetical protein